MQKALKITGIIFGVLLAIAAVIFFIVAAVINGVSADTVKELVSQGYKEADAKAAVTTLITIYIVLGVICVPGAVVSFLLAAFSKRESPKKVEMIILGIVAILFGAEVPGVLAIIHGAKNGQ